MSLPPCCTLLEPRPLPSAGVTRLLRYYGPLRHPAGPGWSSRIPGWRVRATVGASRVAAVSLLHACRRQYPGGTGRCSRRSLPDRCQPSPFQRRVGFRITRFEACSAFTLVAACVLAESPMATLCHRSASVQFVTSSDRSDCFRLERQLPGGVRTRWDTAPFHGAHRSQGYPGGPRADRPRRGRRRYQRDRVRSEQRHDRRPPGACGSNRVCAVS